MTLFLSQKFKFFSFVSMIFLVYVHGYNLQDTYLQPWSMVQEQMTVTTFVEYLLANGLLRFRIPMLFVISGYLYAFTDQNNYTVKTLKRLRNLGIPYLIWSILALCLTYFLEFIPITKEAIQATGLAMFSDKIVFVSQYNWEGLIGRTFFAPIAFQLWFIRVLLVYNIAYPAIRYCVINYPKTWFVCMLLFWISTINLFLIEGTGLLFFSLGIWLQKTNFDIEKQPTYLSNTIIIILFISTAFIKTYLAFLGYSFFAGHNGLLIGILHKICELTGFIGIWYGMDKVVRICAKNTLVQYLQPFTFIIYAMHVPILYYVMYIGNAFLANWQYHRIFTFLCIPLVVILFSIICGIILRKIVPTLYGFLTGGRGFV